MTLLHLLPGPIAGATGVILVNGTMVYSATCGPLRGAVFVGMSGGLLRRVPIVSI